MDYFDDYTKTYDLNEPKLEYKYYHSIRVMDNMELIAKNLSLPVKDVTLAKCIGILHDIGRFEQQIRYKSFSDFNLDHGDYGASMLKDTNALKHYDIDEEDYEVVYKAIRNHNKFKIEDGLTSRELLFAKMIRDADKLDILFALSSPKIKGILWEDDSIISPDVSEDFFNGEMIKITKENTINEKNVIVFGFIYDINYKFVIDIIKTNEYYDKIYARFKNKELFAPYLESVKKYMEERTD
jgi:putative nucleotidyltransferase with HDIG domain